MRKLINYDINFNPYKLSDHFIEDFANYFCQDLQLTNLNVTHSLYRLGNHVVFCFDTLYGKRLHQGEESFLDRT